MEKQLPNKNQEGDKGKKSLASRLERYPQLRARMEGVLDIVENVRGDLDKADDAEQQVIEELRQMGRDILNGWAGNQEQQKSEELQNIPTTHKYKKKQ